MNWVTQNLDKVVTFAFSLPLKHSYSEGIPNIRL
jgi:hypothetical protein